MTHAGSQNLGYLHAEAIRDCNILWFWSVRKMWSLALVASNSLHVTLSYHLLSFFVSFFHMSLMTPVTSLDVEK